MSKLYAVVAGDINFKEFTTKCYESSKPFVEKTFVYDLGNLGFGEPFTARFSQGAGAKIPSKPNIIKHAINKIDFNDYLIWLDADTLVFKDLNGFKLDYDIGVTIRKPGKCWDNPINAGVVVLKKTENCLKFLETWIATCEDADSDQRVLNKLIKVDASNIGKLTVFDNLNVYGFSCEEYNNFYFKSKNQNEVARIKHYKSKYRKRYPIGETAE